MQCELTFVGRLYKGNRFLGRLWVKVVKKYPSPSCLDADECFPGQNLGEKNLSEKNIKRIFAHNVIPVSEMDLVI